jgi:hypothetical protein
VLVLALASAAWGCVRPAVPAAAAPGPPVADASFRARDVALLGAFAALEGRCAPRWQEDPGCLADLRKLRAEEIRLFDEVRAHRFSDITESKYWHRGRLKFPGEIQQTLERVESSHGGVARIG